MGLINQNYTGPNELGSVHISSDLQNYEPARSNYFSFIVTGLGKLPKPYTDTQNTEYITGGGQEADHTYDTSKQKVNKYDDAGDILRLSVTKAFVPHFSTDPIEIKRGNSVVKFAGNPTWDSGTLEVSDFVGLESKEVLMSWQMLAYDQNTDWGGRADEWDDGGGQHHMGYKKDCWLIEYTPDHQPIRSWKLIGCWIRSLQEQPFEVDGSGARSITVNIEYDRALPYSKAAI